MTKMDVIKAMQEKGVFEDIGELTAMLEKDSEHKRGNAMLLRDVRLLAQMDNPFAFSLYTAIEAAQRVVGIVRAFDEIEMLDSDIAEYAERLAWTITQIMRDVIKAGKYE